MKELTELGFQFIDCGDPAEVLLNQYFSNFQIGDFLKAIYGILNPVSSQNLKMTVSFKMTGPSLIIEIVSENFAEDGLALVRTFKYEQDELYVIHDFFTLPTIHQQKGIAKKIFSLSIQQYLNLNIQKIKVRAGLDGGGYAWALYDFHVADKKQIDAILEKAKTSLDEKQFNFVRRIYDRYYSKNIDGNSFPISKWAEMPFMKDVLRGSSWEGFVDLNNKEQFNNFIYYATS